MSERQQSNVTIHDLNKGMNAIIQKLEYLMEWAHPDNDRGRLDLLEPKVDDLNKSLISSALNIDHMNDRLINVESDSKTHIRNIQLLTQAQDSMIEKMADYEKMEWTSTPLNNLATQYTNQATAIDKINQSLQDVTRRLDAFVDIDIQRRHDIYKIHERLAYLENWVQPNEDRPNYNGLDKRLKELETEVYKHIIERLNQHETRLDAGVPMYENRIKALEVKYENLVQWSGEVDRQVNVLRESLFSSQILKDEEIKALKMRTHQNEIDICAIGDRLTDHIDKQNPEVKHCEGQMDFMNAWKAMMDGARIERLDWDSEVYIYLQPGTNKLIRIFNCNQDENILSAEDLSADDWVTRS